ncbi:C40 family peptidase [Desulfonatronum lacustre]|uniref:C40 family peptidase n=1 Tax=Desulfonatronum lacustre TaxID=66849 RepID=UPI0006883BBA|nr:C40 family peptidase [Desulfonatronum lacustre]SMP51974.1 NlpC/P60 family protein [Desulfonatronum zhilinae]
MRNSAISKNAFAASGAFTLLVRLNIRTSLQRLAVLLLPLAFLATLAGCGARHPPPRPAIPGSVAESVVQTALSKNGRPYVRGGTSPTSGFDCSGLVVWIFGKHGVELPRTAREQARSGVSVPLRQLQAGDLVFFRIGMRGSYHVGIATGRGTFVHSPRPGQRVREESLFASYWQQRLIAVRRVL